MNKLFSGNMNIKSISKLIYCIIAIAHLCNSINILKTKTDICFVYISYQCMLKLSENIFDIFSLGIWCIAYNNRIKVNTSPCIYISVRLENWRWSQIGNKFCSINFHVILFNPCINSEKILQIGKWRFKIKKLAQDLTAGQYLLT